MAINPADASAAYRAHATPIPGAGGPTDATGAEPAAGTFLDMVRGAARETIDANREAEQVAARAIAGRAELTEVVGAMAHAEQTLTTVVRVRDRMITAYQQVMRMPI